MVTCSVSLCGPDPNTDYFNDKTFGTTKRERKILKVFKKNDKTWTERSEESYGWGGAVGLRGQVLLEIDHDC